MQFATSLHTGPTPECQYEVNDRDLGKGVAFCATQHDAIRIAIALNMLERQKHGQPPATPTAPKPTATATATDKPVTEARCSHCWHRFPAHKIGTLHITYATQEETKPCCPMCGEIVDLTATTTPTYAEWWEMYRK